MKETSLLLQLTGEIPLFKIVDFLVENKGLDFSKEEIIAGANISRATLFNYWNQIEKFGVVKTTRTEGKVKYYTLNANNLIIQRILDLETALIRSSLDATEQRISEETKGAHAAAEEIG